MKKTLNYVVVALVAMSLVSCAIGDSRKDFDISVYPSEVTIDNDGGTILVLVSCPYTFGRIKVYAYGQWQVDDSFEYIDNSIAAGAKNNWLVATRYTDSANNQFIQIVVSPNETGSYRKASVVVSNSVFHETVIVNQSK